MSVHVESNEKHKLNRKYAQTIRGQTVAITFPVLARNTRR
ncbi:MAG: hypothetical protein ACI8RE_003357 [Ilumatobacter sp.]|jgi:hypothetical protein